MKQLCKVSLIASLVLGNSVFALNPVQGIYGGILGEASSGPSDQVLHFTRDNMAFTGTVKSNPLGGGGGGVIGYRIQKFRAEAEVLYNRIAYDTLTVGSCVIQSPTITTPVGNCPQDHFQADALGFNGSTSGIYGMINGYLDFFGSDTETYVVPYVGVGIGMAQIKNSRNFVNTITLASRGNSVKSNAGAAQGIIGVSFYMDDYAWAGMDYRYLSTNNVKDFENTRYAVSTLNFNVNFAFDNS